MQTTLTNREIVHCPRCGQSLAYVAELAGRGVSCPTCHARFAMPGPAPEPQAPPLPPVALGVDPGPPSISSRRYRAKPKDYTLGMAIAGTCACVAVVLGLIAVLMPSADSPGGSAARNSINTAFDDSISAALGCIVLAVLMLIGLLIYLTPTVIAVVRKHQDMAAIVALNILVGWTFLGWVASLVWSLTEVRSRDHYHYHARGR